MTYIKVKNNAPFGDLYSNNDVTLLENEIILPVIEHLPEFDSAYQYLSERIFTVLGDFVEIRYTVINNTAIYPSLITSRLTDFARQRDIDIEEIGMLLNCNNLTWRSEAERFMNLYTGTWTAFYATQSDDWLEIQSELPELTW